MQTDAHIIVNPKKTAEENMDNLITMLCQLIEQEQTLFFIFIRELLQSNKMTRSNGEFNFPAMIYELLSRSADSTNIGKQNIDIKVLGMWSMTILTGGITEGLVEITFHLVSEFLMAILLLISGIGLLRGNTNGRKLFLISNGMLIYSVLNAAGYYGKGKNIGMTIMFLVFFIISSGLLLFALMRKDE